MINPLISIIVPVYNVENYIRKCIESIVNQDYANIEILVVNDGTKDNSINEIKDIIDPRIRILHKTNGGLADARNYGINHASGKYLYFVDSDDWIESGLISSCVGRMEEKECDIIYFNYFVDTYSKLGDLIETETSNLDQIVQDTIEILPIMGYVWNKLYRKSFIDSYDLSFNKDLKIYEDIDFNLACFSKTKNILLVEDAFYHYNNRLVESLIKSYNPSNVTYFNFVQKKLENYMLSGNYTEKQILQVLSSYIMTTFRHQSNAIFQFTNFTIFERTKILSQTVNDFENIKFVKYYKASGVKELIIKNLLKRKWSLILNIIMTLKK